MSKVGRTSMTICAFKTHSPTTRMTQSWSHWLPNKRTRTYSRYCGIGGVNAKERDKYERQGRRAKERKGIKAQRAKPPTLTRAIGALIEDENQNEKQKKKKKP